MRFARAELWVLLLVMMLPTAARGQPPRGQISVEELSLMTLSELARTADAECAEMTRLGEQMRGYIGKARQYADGGYSASAMQMSGYANEAAEQGAIHKDNLGRVRLVVRKQLNGEEPAWITDYAGAQSSGECNAAKAAYEAWSQPRVSPTPKQKPKQKKGKP